MSYIQFPGYAWRSTCIWQSAMSHITQHTECGQGVSVTPKVASCDNYHVWSSGRYKCGDRWLLGLKLQGFLWHLYYKSRSYTQESPTRSGTKPRPAGLANTQAGGQGSEASIPTYNARYPERRISDGMAGEGYCQCICESRE